MLVFDCRFVYALLLMMIFYTADSCNIDVAVRYEKYDCNNDC
jgi:hypothetical protein